MQLVSDVMTYLKVNTVTGFYVMMIQNVLQTIATTELVGGVTTLSRDSTVMGRPVLRMLTA